MCSSLRPCPLSSMGRVLKLKNDVGRRHRAADEGSALRFLTASALARAIAVVERAGMRSRAGTPAEAMTVVPWVAQFEKLARRRRQG
jgi:hypothetical protein